ncbi:MAG TPA: hypothetical protein PLA77_09005, partial [Bacteroidales bacterium]|nr:hypothetical protein [Bacteroidales bacterium]
MAALLLFATNSDLFAQAGEVNNFTYMIQGQQYDRAIHIMVMLLVGFGFLMVFVRKYGRSALTATFLLVSISLPTYMLIKSTGVFGEGGDEIKALIL